MSATRSSLSERWRSWREPEADADQGARPGPRLSDLVLITGFSGAGKSTAMHVFEDAGYFCVDNLPPEMIRSLAELFLDQGSSVERAAIVCDVRGGSYFEALEEVLEELRRVGLAPRILFLEAEEQTLLNRYKETRRRHPLSPEGTVSDGIAAESALLSPFKERADLVVDTTGLLSAVLRKRLIDEMLPDNAPHQLAVTFSSFGYKHGPPRDTDLAFDVRFLPNPHWDPNLRPLTGLDERVVAYVGRDGTLERFYAHLVPLLEFLLPQYVAEGKSHLVVGIGCTGGRHRSVAIAEHLGRRFAEREEYLVEVAHRDIDRATRAAPG